MGRRISKEFLHPSILEGVNNKIGNLDSLETDAKGNMVQAINELVEKLDNSAEIENGKELIANAVGEPLTAEESFDEMSSDINSLLSTFKTNMMNNGITVNSSDRFKSLIDKIATMVEEGSGKGIQFAEGIHEPTDYIYDTDYDIETNLDFTPTLVFCVISNYLCTDANQYQNYVIGNFTQTNTHSGYSICYIKSVTASKFTLHTYNANRYIQINGRDDNVTLHWYAIGVGEEDTTLRDSLASILTEEGVSVTEEDDMASLISKVGNEFSNIKELSLYNRGDMCDKITGGWSFESNMNSADYYIHEINEDHVYFWLRCNTDTGYVRMITNNLIDLTNYNSIFIEANGFVSETSSNHRVYIFLKSSDGTEVTLTDFLYPTSDTGSYSGKFINLADYKYLGNCYISVGLKMPRYASTNCQTGCNILKLMLSK